MSVSPREFLAIHSNDNIQIAKSLYVKELHVHLGNPGPVVDVGDHQFQYTKVEFHGKGVFRMLRHGKQLWRFEK